jgi:hypothetical protein
MEASRDYIPCVLGEGETREIRVMFKIPSIYIDPWSRSGRFSITSRISAGDTFCGQALHVVF